MEPYQENGTAAFAWRCGKCHREHLGFLPAARCCDLEKPRFGCGRCGATYPQNGGHACKSKGDVA